MRNNDKPYTTTRKITIGTPLSDKYLDAYKKNQKVLWVEDEYLVVDASRVKGSDIIEFYLQRVGVKK